MPKCKKCGSKMPKNYSYCGVCGADMNTGMVPYNPNKVVTSNEDTKSIPKNPVINPAPKVSMTPNQNIDEFLEDTPSKETTKVQPTQTAKTVTPPPQQRFTPATNSVNTQPTQTAKTVTPPPQQRFTPATNSVNTQPTQTAKTVTPPPQQRFTPATNPMNTQPTQTAKTVTPPPQQRFTPATNSVNTQTVQTVKTVTPPPQQRFTPNTNQTPSNVDVTKQPTPVSVHTSKPAYIPKPTPNTQPIEMVRVPNVTGMNQDEARNQLERLGFRVSISTDNSNVVKPNIVMSQNIQTGNEVVKGSEIKVVVSVGTWSDWSIERVLDTNMYIVEQKKQFRSRTRTREIETHESSERNLPGYTCIDQKKVYSEWEDEGYYTTENRETSETCDISTNLIGFKYCGYSYVGDDLNIDLCYSTKESALIFNPNTKPDDWEYIETVLYQDIPSQTVDWYPANDTERTTPAGDIIDCNIKMTSYYIDGKRYAMKYGSLGTEWFLYHKRSEIETVYTYKREYFTEWSEWSNWGDTAIKQDELNEVEARILYRARRKTSKDLG